MLKKNKLTKEQKSNLKKVLKKWKMDNVKPTVNKITSASGVLAGGLVASDLIFFGGVGIMLFSIIPGSFSIAGAHLSLTKTQFEIGNKKLKAPIEVGFTLAVMQRDVKKLFNQKSNSNQKERNTINQELSSIKEDLKHLEPFIKEDSFAASKTFDTSKDLNFEVKENFFLNIEDVINIQPKYKPRIKGGFKL